MKYCIVYKSKHGTTRTLVERMQVELGKEQTHLVELGKDEVPDLSKSEIILVGGSIHAGQIQKEIRKFCSTYREILLQKKLGLFLCFMLDKKADEEFAQAFPEDLRKHAIATGLLGGELLIEKMNWFDRFMVKMVGRTSQSVSNIDEKAFSKFLQQIKEAVQAEG